MKWLEKRRQVHKVIDELGLTSCADTKVTRREEERLREVREERKVETGEKEKEGRRERGRELGKRKRERGTGKRKSTCTCKRCLL